MWQQVMDLEGTNRSRAINLALRTRPRFQRRKEKYHNARLDWFYEEDWYVLHTEKYERVDWLGPVAPKGLLQLQALFEINSVWSDDFKTHAEHQSYTRQHPCEEWKVRKVECGLAFVFKRDDKINFIEVE